MYIPRNIERRLRQLVRFFPAVAISGARQTGKTTLLRHCFPEYDYVSLDLPSKAEQAELNPSEFLDEHPGPVIIDEVQYAPRSASVSEGADRRRAARKRQVPAHREPALFPHDWSEREPCREDWPARS